MHATIRGINRQTKHSNVDFATTILESDEWFTYDQNTNINSDASEVGVINQMKEDTNYEVDDGLRLDSTLK